MPQFSYNNIYYYPGFLNLKSLAQNQKEAKTSDFYIRINNCDQLLQLTTFNRLCTAQLAFNLPNDILTWDKDTIEYLNLKNNLSFNILKMILINDLTF